MSIPPAIKQKDIVLPNMDEENELQKMLEAHKKFYFPVDDDDIQSGLRVAIELKPGGSNEDAFFILPEKQAVLQSIMFIQTAIDQLKRYLPTICSRALEISKEKQNKIFDVLDKIDEFLALDSQDLSIEGDLQLPSGFSKD